MALNCFSYLLRSALNHSETLPFASASADANVNLSISFPPDDFKIAFSADKNSLPAFYFPFIAIHFYCCLASSPISFGGFLHATAACVSVRSIGDYHVSTQTSTDLTSASKSHLPLTGIESVKKCESRVRQ